MVQEEGPASSDGPWSQIGRRIRLTDLVILSLVPAALVVVYALPEATKRALALEYTTPTLLTAFTNHFVHLSLSHLVVNLLGYVVVVTLVYVLSLASGRRRRFFVVFVTFLLAFPLALSALNLVFARPTTGVGFSGIVLAFVGYLPLALLGFVDRHFEGPVDRLSSSWLFFAGIAFIAHVTVPGLVGMGLTLAAILASVLVLLPVVEKASLTHLFEAIGRLRTPGYIELTGLALLVFGGSLLIAFPSEVTTGAGTLNVYTHTLGFSLGFVVAYVTVLLDIAGS